MFGHSRSELRDRWAALDAPALALLDDDYYPLVARLFPGARTIATDVKVVLISVVFNRGPAKGHDPEWSSAKEVDRRFEMR